MNMTAFKRGCTGSCLSCFGALVNWMRRLCHSPQYLCSVCNNCVVCQPFINSARFWLIQLCHEWDRKGGIGRCGGNGHTYISYDKYRLPRSYYIVNRTMTTALRTIRHHQQQPRRRWFISREHFDLVVLICLRLVVMFDGDFFETSETIFPTGLIIALLSARSPGMLYTKDYVLAMERQILRLLNYTISIPNH